MVDERRRLIPPRLDAQEDDGTACCVPTVQNKKVAQGTILVTVAFERLAFYSISGNLVLFLNGTEYDWTSYNAVSASFFFLGISCVFFFIGGCVADALLGRFRCILLAFLVYVIGYALFPVISNPYIVKSLLNVTDDHDGDTDSPKQSMAWLIYLALFVVSAGTGMVRANIAPFGADQLRGETPQNTAVFFNWYYWAINVGTLVALSGIAYVQQSVPDNGFFYSYLASSACLVVGVFIFIAGKCSYTTRKPVGSIFVNIFKIIREAWRISARKKARRNQHSRNIASFRDGTVDSAERPTVTSFLDHAKFRFGGSFHDHSVDDIKMLGRIICIFIALVPYWMVYYQTETMFLVQGLHMRLKTNLNSSYVVYKCTTNDTTDSDGIKVDIAVAWLCLFDVVLLVILIPVMDRVIYPWLRKHEWDFSMVKRMFLGQVFAVLAIVIAGLVEHYRLKTYWSDPKHPCCYERINQTIQSTNYYAANMSILWQIPQYSLIGLSEVFTSVAGLEFASLLAPKSMKSSIMGLFYLFSSLGSFLSSALVYSLENHWFYSRDHGNINSRKCSPDGKSYSEASHLDYFFYLLAGIQGLGILVFLMLVRKYDLSRDPHIVMASSHIQEGLPRRQRSVTTDPVVQKKELEVSHSALPTSDVANGQLYSPVHTPAPPNVVNEFQRTVSKDSTGRIGAMPS